MFGNVLCLNKRPIWTETLFHLMPSWICVKLQGYFSNEGNKKVWKSCENLLKLSICLLATKKYPTYENWHKAVPV